MKWNSLKTKAALAFTALLSTLAQAGPDLGAAEQQATNWSAIIMFAIFVGFTLLITKSTICLSVTLCGISLVVKMI